VRSVVAVILAGLVTAAVVLGYWYARSPRRLLVKPGDAAPDLALPGVVDGQARLSDYRRSPVVLVLFDTRWPITERYLWSVERLHRRALARGLVVLGVALDEDRGALRRYLVSHAVTFPVVWDPAGRAVGPTYGVPRDAKPSTYVIAPGGRVEVVYVDPVEWSNDELREPVERLLPREAGRPAAAR
jgi:peroxiredoxin